LVLDHSGPELLGRDDEVQAVAAALAGLARLCDEAAPTQWTRMRRWLERSVGGRRKTAAAAMAVVLAAVGLFPVADRVTCSTTLEPSVRRYIGAPFDGKLEKAVAKVGDAVVAGQTIAELDRSSLEIELLLQEAEYDEAAKRRDAARAKGQAAVSQLADLEAAQLQRKIERLKHQLEQLTITSPIAGVIVRGELQRVEGAPLARGQNLFEIAPLSPLVAELAVPEEEVRLVKAGQVAIVRPAALAGRALYGTVQQVHPRAELRDGQTVFIAEVVLENKAGQLRPGMQAQAVVLGARRPLVWTLARRPLTRLMRWMWW
jgi:multidrug efflux pump subunit AcrA (membrane-fusion protein)